MKRGGLETTREVIRRKRKRMQSHGATETQSNWAKRVTITGRKRKQERKLLRLRLRHALPLCLCWRQRCSMNGKDSWVATQITCKNKQIHNGLIDYRMYGQSPYRDSGFRGFNSSMIWILRGGVPSPTGNFPESLSQAILVGIILVGRLGIHRLYTCSYHMHTRLHIHTDLDPERGRGSHACTHRYIELIYACVYIIHVLNHVLCIMCLLLVS